MTTRGVPKWEEFRGWLAVLPPNRPHEENLTRIRERLAASTDIRRVAVLGATLEFRDLLSEYDEVEVTVFERDLKFLKMTNSIRLADSQETVVEGDWRETLPSAESAAFDLVLSDFTSGNLPYEAQPDFYKGVAHILRPGGLFIDRVLIPVSWNDMSDLGLKYQRRPANLRTINDFNADALFLNARTRGVGVVDTKTLYECLDQASEEFIRRLAAMTRVVTPTGQYWYYGRPDSLAAHLERLSDFESLVVAPEPETSVYYKHVHQLVLRRR